MLFDEHYEQLTLLTLVFLGNLIPTCLCGYYGDVNNIQQAIINGYTTCGYQPNGMGVSQMG